MSQRRKEDDEWVWSIGRLVALLLTTALFYPPFRQNIPRAGLVFLGVLVALLILGGLANLIRSSWVNPARGARPSPLEPGFWTQSQTSTYLPQSTYELLRQLREGHASLPGKLLALVYQKLDYRVIAGGAMPLVVERDGVSNGIQYAGPDQGKAGVRLVRRFREALTEASLDKGILITSEGYTPQARKLAASCGIDLLDEADLSRLLDATRAGHDTAILTLLPNSRLAPASRAELPTLTAAESR